jgi:hypothetical protein
MPIFILLDLQQPLEINIDTSNYDFDVVLTRHNIWWPIYHCSMPILILLVLQIPFEIDVNTSDYDVDVVLSKQSIVDVYDSCERYSPPR